MKEDIISFVINLERRPDRLKHFKNNCSIKNVNVVHGFDGKNIEKEDKNEIKLFDKFINFLPGEKGCFISHLRIWNYIVNNDINYGLIFEDDAILCEDFFEKYKIIIKELPEDCDIAFIGGRFESNYKMHENNYIKISENIIKHKKITPEYYYDFCRTTHSYILSKKTAQFLINIFESEKTISTALDHWLVQKIHTQEVSLKIYESSPLLCHSPFISDSDIR
jgi:glycosyl transferase family 25